MARKHPVDSIWASFLRSTFWARDILSRRGMRAQLKSIRRFYGGDKAMAEEFKARQLQQLLSHARSHCVFYSQAASADNISAFPVVTKQTLVDNYNDILVDGSLLSWQRGEYAVVKTSGSTGTPFKVPIDTRKRTRRIAELKYFNEIAGLKSHERLMQLRIWTKWQSKSYMRQIRENINAWDVSSLTSERFAALYQAMKRERSVGLRGYASTIDAFARYVRDNALPPLPYLKIVIAGSEMLSESTRLLSNRYLGGVTISQYANEECGVLAQQTVDGSLPQGAFRLNHASYYFEVLKLDSDEPAAPGELGRIVITDLYNFAFPIIRYANGDCGVMQMSPDGEPYLEKIYGRITDLVYDTHDNPVSPMTLNRTLKNIEGISRWQFAQVDRKSYRLKIVTTSGIPSDVDERLLDSLKQYFGEDADIAVIHVGDIPLLPSGKHKAVMNLWKT